MPRGKGFMKLKDSGVCETLIELVKQHPMIFDVNSEYHRDSRLIAEIWCQITEALQVPGLTVREVKVRWRTLRDSYIRKKKEEAKACSSGDARRNVSTIRWKYMSAMRFLDPYVQQENNHARTNGAVSSEDQDEGSRQQMKDAEIFVTKVEPDDGSCSSTSSVHLDLSDLPGDSSLFSTADTPPPGESSNRSRNRKLTPHHHTSPDNGHTTDKGTDTDGDFKKSFVELVRLQSRVVERLQDGRESSRRSPVDAFFESCALRAKSLSKARQGWLQVEVSKLLYAAESSSSDAVAGVSLRVDDIVQSAELPTIVPTPQPFASVSSSDSPEGLDQRHQKQQQQS